MKGPYILLTALLLILIFVVGVRYGQRVEKVNKVVDYLLSITPSPSPTKMPPTPLVFDTFIHKGCGVSFLYPKGFKAEAASSVSALFTNNSQLALGINCEKKPALFSQLKNKRATDSAIQINNQQIKAQQYTSTGMTTDVFTLRNPVNAKQIMFAVTENLLPLFESSLEFTR